MALAVLSALRVHQWVKNLFVSRPLVFARRVDDPRAVVSAVLPVACFCLLSSAHCEAPCSAKPRAEKGRASANSATDAPRSSISGREYSPEPGKRSEPSASAVPDEFLAPTLVRGEPQN
jgi:hypothetical protein